MATQLNKTDVVVIGLGAAGGTAVLPLTQAGLEVVGLEAGQRYTTADYPLDEIRNDIRNWPGKAKVNNEVPTWRQTPDQQGGDAAAQGGVVVLMNNGVGGSSIHWTSQSWRFLPWNFATRTETINRYGQGMIPPDSTVADWPVTYDDLEPYYDRVEYLHGVSGKAGNLKGQKDPRGNTFEAARQREYPNPPLREAGFGQLVGGAARKLGYHTFLGPSAVRSQPYQGMGGCTYCGFCTSTGCFLDAKGGSQLAGIPQAEKSGHLQVVTGARATAIQVDSQGRATGVTYLKGNQLYFQPAGAVILSSYVYENTRLLLLSTSPAYPNGLSNNHGQVGRDYISHVYCGVNGLFPGKALNTFNGTGAQAVCFDDLNADNFDHTGLPFIGGGIVSISQESKPIATAGGTPPSVPQWGSAWKAWLKKNGNSFAGALAQLESLSYQDQFLDLDPVKKDPQGLSVVRVTYRLHPQEQARYDYVSGKLLQLLKQAGASETWPSFPKIPIPVNSHAYGGTRMGPDPATSVVDSWSVSHEVPNLLVLGGSTFPTSAGYNPTETIMALAWRAGEHLAKNWRTIAG